MRTRQQCPTANILYPPYLGGRGCTICVGFPGRHCGHLGWALILLLGSQGFLWCPLSKTAPTISRFALQLRLLEWYYARTSPDSFLVGVEEPIVPYLVLTEELWITRYRCFRRQTRYALSVSTSRGRRRSSSTTIEIRTTLIAEFTDMISALHYVLT